MGFEKNVRAVVLPEDRRGALDGVARRSDDGQGLVVDVDGFHRIARLMCGPRDDEGNGLADVAHLVDWQQCLRDNADRTAIEIAEADVAGIIRNGAVRNGPDAVSGKVPPGEDVEYTRHGPCPARVDAADERVGVRRAQNNGMGLAGGGAVVAVGAAAREQLGVLAAAQGLANPPSFDG